MSEEKPAGVTGTVGGWIKAAITGVISLVFGAFIMYLTPVVNNAIKPAKPVSNFATQVNGLSVQFNNRSTGGVQGWWDFGDGSALEPFDPKIENVKHAYAKPGTYSVKLQLTNLLGDESDRTAQVTIDADSAASGPEIAEFKLVSVDNRQRAPANYQLLTKVKNASYCILCRGDSQPMEIVQDSASQMHYLTFVEPGTFTVRYAAVNGKQLVEQTKTIQIGTSDSYEPTAKLLVSYDAVRVERIPKDWQIHCDWQGNPRDGASTFRKERPAYPNCTIVSAELVNKDEKGAPVRNAKLEIAPDKSKVIVSGELTRATGLLAPKSAAPSWLAQVKVVMERRGPMETINPRNMSMAVNLNSPTRIPMQPLPDGYEIVRKNVSMQLWDGSRMVWEGNKAMSNAPVTLNNQGYLLTVLPQNDSFVLTIAPVGPAIRPVGFERNPYLPKKTGP